MTDAEPKAVEDERGNDLQTTVCRDGRHINVRNEQSGSGEIHTVHLNENGSVKRCTCKGWVFHKTCYHVDTVRDAPILLSSASVLSAEQSPVPATDGGTETTTEDYIDVGEIYEQEGDRPEDCDCDEQLSADMVCVRCLSRDFATPNPEV